ncbi:hypothetical protein MZO42_08155 [Sphingomonas psychrotolerans]|uniref:Uncharacterized protein n=1 Tax=Sphingomonas psychrotolerans TaxID=1327635 RepID=A0ABU3N290_9SPHN|nr:hypothetical protein [Sphingomonas psychrotolerans]MDT8758668.1 hypothetical protein [Sphingomonas psychrotolerans]
MATQALSDADLQKLDSELQQMIPEAARSSAAGADAAPSISDVKEEFCSIWPKAAPILEIVAKFVKFIPGVGPAAGAIIRGLITAGNTLSSAVCPQG